MITRGEAESLRGRLLAVLAEDGHDSARLSRRLDSITADSGIGARSALLMILARLAFDEDEAVRHWDAVLALREEMSRRLGRDAGLRVAVLDYFMNVNRLLVQPSLIDPELFEAAEREACADSLTGLATSRRFRAALPAELRRADRYAQQAAVVVIDVDELARANELHGRSTADRLLGELAAEVACSVRETDLAARLGEDELALLLPETDLAGAMRVAERVRSAVEARFTVRESRGRMVGLTVSSGVACYPEDAATPESLLEAAAQALYRAKAAGRNAVHAYRPEAVAP